MTHSAHNHSGAVYGDFLDLGETFMGRAKSISRINYEGESISSSLLIAILASVAVVSVAGYFFVRKRKEDI